MPRTARIVSTGRYIPERRVDNDVLRARLMRACPTSSTRWKVVWHPVPVVRARRLGDLGPRSASRAAGARARGQASEDVDLIVLGTDSPDYVTPATSVVLQHKLGATRAGTFDVGCACASFPTGLAAGAGIIAMNPAIRTVLVVGAYLMQRLADPDDPMIFFYGDGAGAVVLEASDTPGFLGAAFQADGAYAEHWGIFAGGTKEPATPENVAAGRTAVRMLQRYPPRSTTRAGRGSCGASPVTGLRCRRLTSSSSPRCVARASSSSCRIPGCPWRGRTW